MRLTKKLEAEILRAYHLMWEANINGDIKTFSSYLDDQVLIYGTAEGEILRSKKEAEEYYKATADQMTGKADFRNRRITTSIIGEAVVVNELNDLYVLSGDNWIFYGHPRITGIFEQKGDVWKLVHMHGSFPDSRTEEGEQIAVEKIEAENQQLREAVKRRTVELEDKNRELQIEAALEKVRTVAMGMKSPEDMLSICKTIAKQLDVLGLENIRNTQTAIFYPDRGTYMNYEYYAKHDKTFVTDVDYQNHPIQLAFARKMMKGAGEEVREHLTGKDLRDWYAFQQTTNQFADEYILQAESLNYYWFSLGPVALGISTYAPLSPQEIELFKRFLKVFELAYQRYLDIEKALIQAREAQIEAALERVRAKAMAMHNSADLPKTAITAFSELKKLGFSPIRTGISIQNRENRKNLLYAATSSDSGENLTLVGWAILDHHPVLREVYDKWYIGEDCFPELHGEILRSYYEQIKGSFDVPVEQTEIDQYGYFIHFTFGLFYGWCRQPVTEEEKKLLRRFTAVIDLTFKRYFDLQKAEAQAKESQIQLALERVRAKTMAMQRSEELPEVAGLLFQQVKTLGVPQFHCGFNIFEIDDKECTWYPGSADGEILPPCKIPLTEHPVFIAFNESRKRGDELLVYEKEGEYQAGHYRYMLSLPVLGEILQNMLDAGIPFPTFQIDHVANFSHGNLLFITSEHFPEMHDTFKRFAKVFDQTYTRFLDLQKAEAQAREAQVEAALERVRARAMAMQKSQELVEVVHELRTQMGLLGQKELETCVIQLYDESPDYIQSWAGIRAPDSAGSILAASALVPKKGLLIMEEVLAAYAANKQDYVLVNEGEKLRQWFSFLEKASPESYTRLVESVEGDIGALTAFWSFADFDGGSLLMVTRDQPDDYSRSLLRRFSNVFGLAYRRFADIKKAEAQAREAQIEASLERVRSRTMAMQKPEDLADTAHVLFEQLQGLGVTHERVNIGIVNEATGNIDFWLTEQGGNVLNNQFTCRISEPTTISKVYQAWKAGSKSLVVDLQGKALEQWIQFLQTEANIPFQAPVKQHRRVHTAGFFSKGMLIVSSPEPLPQEAIYLLERFAGVFDLTYTRFSDLKTAEAQAREATKQASLDRVRAVIASMRSTEDLELITPLMFKELTILGVPFIRCGVFIIHEEQQVIDAYLSSPSGASLGVLHLPFLASELTMQTVEAWRKGQVHRQHWSQVDFIAWTNQMMEQHQIESSRTYQGADTAPESLDLHFVPFSQGMLYVGSLQALGDQDLELVLALAKSFSIAYARYEDFVKLETAKANIESTLTELKATQAQLIQQEKLASLGQLTAGIAHEIQNPLNFVNNFSEINAELSEEILDAAANGDLEEVKALATDIKSNQEKIREHGKRADSIVKGMLQHSRSSAGTREPTDLAGLADEYLRLAYHGMRAKDKSFNASLKTDFEDGIPLVAVVAQDIGRVLLNLFNNAFYAVNERKKTGGDGYEPQVNVRIRKDHTRPDPSIVITVSDNGSGIPESIKAKIFQPFFTTKPTGQGTGLGLSLSYDIVKAHDGELKVDTHEGSGTEFIINIPIAQI